MRHDNAGSKQSPGGEAFQCCAQRPATIIGAPRTQGTKSANYQWLNHRCPAGGNIGRAEISVVSKQGFGFAQNFWQSNDLVQHRFELLLVVGGLHHINGHHQQAALGHHRLDVVALLEPAACHRHDAGFFVGQIDLIGRLRAFHRRLRRLTTGLLPVASILASRASTFA
jgi:hypothetical protein